MPRFLQSYQSKILTFKKRNLLSVPYKMKSGEVMNLTLTKDFNSKISSNIGEAGKLIDNALHYIESYISCSDEFMFDTKVILSELIQNAIKHGNGCNSNKYVELAIHIENEHIFITVKDEGEGYNYKRLIKDNKNRENQFIELCCQKETGRGILIVDNLCEKLVFNKEGNQITAIKKF